MKKLSLFGVAVLSALALASCSYKSSESTSAVESSNVATPSSSASTPSTEVVPVYSDISLTSIDVKIGQSSKIIGEVSRTLPVEGDEGLDRYPTYGTNLANITEEEKDAILAEDSYIRASSSTYDKMDANGNLYLNGVKLERKLYKHTAASSMFFGEVRDDEKAVIKEISINPRAMGNYITGLYAPAGEIIKVELSREDLEKTGGVKIEMGQYAQNNNLNNIWKARNDFCRMPNIGNEMLVDDTTGYVGCYLGGPIYVTPINNVPFTIRITGAVEYCHFIYGSTTEEEFNRLKETSAPYFDLEVWDNCVRHSGPKSLVTLEYDNLSRVSDFYLKMSNVSRQIPTGSNINMGINFLYDPFVCAGAACAIVGRNWCNLPTSWMNGSLDYDQFTKEGMWGTIHEYNHHFQRYGINPGDEVTNNAVSLLTYILYTDISSKRSTLTEWSWNRFLDPYTSVNETLTASNSSEAVSSLSAYADIIHAFGVDKYIEACNYPKGVQGLDNWYEALCETMQMDMSYYFTEILHQNVSEEIINKYSDLEKFVPVAMKYQTGRVINGNKITTATPYLLEYYVDQIIDLDKDLILPEGFTYTVKNLYKPTNGKLTKNEDGTYLYVSSGLKNSGDITFELEIEGNGIKKNVTIIVEFASDHIALDATRYDYDKQIYKNPLEAYYNLYDGYTKRTYEEIYKHNINGVRNNQIYTYEGMLYIDKAGEYKFSVCASSRGNTYIEFGVNTESYSYTDNILSMRDDPINPEETYITYNLKEGDYVFFHIVLQSYHNDAYADVYYSYNGSKMADYPNKYLFNSWGKGFKRVVSTDKYPRVYTLDNYTISNKDTQVYSYTDSYSSWDDSLVINNVVDGDIYTSYHSVKDKLITTEPFDITIDLGKSVTADNLTIYGYTGNQSHLPITFDLYVGDNANDLKLIKSYTDLEDTNRIINATFDVATFRYYKLHITDTKEHRYVALRELVMGLSVNGTLISPTNASFKATSPTGLTVVDEGSTFGKVVKGSGIISLTTTGEVFGLLTNNKSSVTVDITINGVKKRVVLGEGDSTLTYFTKLSKGEYSIKIEVISGTLVLNSFVV